MFNALLLAGIDGVQIRRHTEFVLGQQRRESLPLCCRWTNKLSYLQNSAMSAEFQS